MPTLLQRGNGQAAQKEYQERIHGLWQKHDCNPMKSLVSLLVQAPVFICFFGALRHMAAAHVRCRDLRVLWGGV